MAICSIVCLAERGHHPAATSSIDSTSSCYPHKHWLHYISKTSLEAILSSTKSASFNAREIENLNRVSLESGWQK